MRELDFSEWIGRQTKAEDVITADPVARLSATLDRDDELLSEGEGIPPLAHWFFPAI